MEEAMFGTDIFPTAHEAMEEGMFGTYVFFLKLIRSWKKACLEQMSFLQSMR